MGSSPRDGVPVSSTQLSSVCRETLRLVTPLPHLLLENRHRATPVAAGPGGIHTWDEFRQDVAGLCAALRARPPGAALLCCDNSYNFTVGLCAVLHEGREAILPQNSREQVLREMSEHHAAIVSDSLFELPGLLHPLQHGPDTASLHGLSAEAKISLMTSGSTGESKKVQKRLAQLAAEVTILERQFGDLVGEAIVFATVPNRHIYGLLFRILWPLLTGRTFAVESILYPEELLPALNAARSVLISSPAYLRRLPESVALESFPRSSALVFSSGGPLPPDTARRYRDAGIPVREIYGSTETGGIAWRDPADERSCPWTALPDVSLTLDDGGQLIVRSPFAGTEDTGDGVTTGDCAEFAPDGTFRLLGRLDRIVKVEEKRISLDAIEQALLTHTKVRDVAAVVLEIRRRSVIGVAIEPAEQNDEGRLAELRGELKNLLAAQFDPILVPRRWRFVRALPRSEGGKLHKRDLLALFAASPRFGEEVVAEGVSGAAYTRRLRLESLSSVLLEGHFPNFPVVPGVVQLQWVVDTLKSGGIAPGALVAMEQVKFQSMVEPGADLDIEVQWDGERNRASYVVSQGVKRCASGKLVFSGADR